MPKKQKVQIVTKRRSKRTLARVDYSDDNSEVQKQVSKRNKQKVDLVNKDVRKQKSSKKKRQKKRTLQDVCEEESSIPDDQSKRNKKKRKKKLKSHQAVKLDQDDANDRSSKQKGKKTTSTLKNKVSKKRVAINSKSEIDDTNKEELDLDDSECDELDVEELDRPELDSDEESDNNHNKNKLRNADKEKIGAKRRRGKADVAKNNKRRKFGGINYVQTKYSLGETLEHQLISN